MCIRDRRKPVQADDGTGKAPSFASGFLLQFINVKVILYGISALSSYVLPYESGVPAVSYTHLDVYKRQLLCSAGGRM